jgi:hypothetical protein
MPCCNNYFANKDSQERAHQVWFDVHWITLGEGRDRCADERMDLCKRSGDNTNEIGLTGLSLSFSLGYERAGNRDLACAGTNLGPAGPHWDRIPGGAREAHHRNIVGIGTSSLIKE